MRKLISLCSPLFLLFAVSCGNNSSSELASLGGDPIDQCSQLVGSCEYYSCIERERLSCGEQGYLLGYGVNYCQKLSAIDFPSAETDLGAKVFPADGNIWKADVRSCLQVEMEKFFRATQKPTCQQLRSFAFNSHPGCYTKKVSFCEMNVQSIVKVGFTIAPKDLVSVESQKQVRETAGICVEQINDRLRSEGSFLVRLQLLKYKAIWKTVASSPASLTEWLGKFSQDGNENAAQL